jgi:hypothetical protein
MIRLLMGLGAFLLAADAFQEKHRQNFGNYEWAEVALTAVLVLGIIAITLIHGDDD